MHDPEAATLTTIRARHRQARGKVGQYNLGRYCRECNADWPCDTAVLLAVVDALTAERDALLATLRRIDALGADGLITRESARALEAILAHTRGGEAPPLLQREHGAVWATPDA
ncbi:MAG TPA: hypothetical protein VFL91_20930 [Thermomicrobiales bacterium]|nr:hypothetical protein [Thermomicrobiales bacterium]